MVVVILVFFFLRLTRCQVNDCKPPGMPAYGWKRPSRAKTAADHPVSTDEPPPMVWGKIKEVFKAFAGRGVVPKWTAYCKAQVIKTRKPWMELSCFAQLIKLVKFRYTEILEQVRCWRGLEPGRARHCLGKADRGPSFLARHAGCLSDTWL